MAELTVTRSIADLPRDQWDRCFPGELESWDYYRAVEMADLAEFEWRYFALQEGQDLLAVVPAFITDYRLDTTMQGPWKRVTEQINRRFPRLLALRLLSLGSPVGEICHLGFAPSVNETDKVVLLRQLLAGLDHHAADLGIGLLGIKDAAERDGGVWQAATRAEGYQRLPGLPTAHLPLPYASEADYFASLSAGTRKDLRRKLKAASAIRIERRHDLSDVRDQVMALYAETLDRSQLQFERLPAGYFEGVLRQLGDRASCFLYWAGDQLVAFNLVLHDRDRLIDKFLGMHYPAVPTYNLYFLSWMTNVRFCLANGIANYQSGQAGYGPKRRLGSALAPNWLYFRHRHPVLNRVLAVVGQLVRLDRFDDELAPSRREAA